MAVRLHIRWPVGAAVFAALAAATVVAGLATEARAAIEGPQPPRAVALAEVTPCYSANEPTAAAQAVAAPGIAQVTVVIPPTAWVRVRDDRPVAAITNTGCFPRATDRFFVGDTAADPAVIAALLACSPSGD